MWLLFFYAFFLNEMLYSLEFPTVVLLFVLWNMLLIDVCVFVVFVFPLFFCVDGLKYINNLSTTVEKRHTHT